MSAQLPQYRRVQTVGAFQIVAITRDAEGALLVGGDDLQEHVTHHWLGVHNPRVGGYFVRQSNLREIYTPRQDFEDAGFAPIIDTLGDGVDAGNNTASARRAHAEAGLTGEGHEG